MEYQYVKKALKEQQWAFVSDVVRFYVLYEYGGVYLDTDVEVIKPFDELLNNNGIIASETIEGLTLNAAVIGLEKNSKFAKTVLQFYFREDGYQFFAIPYVLNRIFSLSTYDLTVLPPETFYPFNPFDKSREVRQLMFSDVKKNTYAIHHWNQSWLLNQKKLGIFKRVVRKIKREYFGLCQWSV